MIYANRCSASYNHSAYFQASQVNRVLCLSVSNRSQTKSGYYSIILYTGNQRVDNTNSSMNNAFLIFRHHSQAHTALSQTARYLLVFALFSILSQKQYQCHMLRKSDMYMFPIFISF